MENLSTEINVEKSIKKGRLVFQAGLFTLYFSYLLSSTFIAISLFLAIGLYKYSFLFTLLLLPAAIWFTLGLFSLIKLVKVDGARTKKDLIVKYISDKYPKLIIEPDDTSGLIRFVRLSGLFHGGKIVTIIFNDDAIYLNMINLGRNDVYSPFNGWINYIDCKEIARYFSKSI